MNSKEYASLIASYEPSVTLEPAINFNTNTKQSRDLYNSGANYNPGRTAKSNEKGFIGTQRKISGYQKRYPMDFANTPESRGQMDSELRARVNTGAKTSKDLDEN